MGSNAARESFSIAELLRGAVGLLKGLVLIWLEDRADLV